jgi:sodium/potassium/calcium exchanger 6
MPKMIRSLLVSDFTQHFQDFMLGMNILYSLWCLWLFIALGLVADAFFVPNLTKISSQLKLSENVAGVTLVAFGNGAPDIFSAIASFGAGGEVAKLAIGSLIGMDKLTV